MPEFGTDPTPQDYKAVYKKKEAEIQSANTSIKKKRAELKKLSESITKIIEKKLIFSNPYQTQQARPKFNPQFQDPRLNQLQQERELLHSHITDLKAKITAIKSEEEPEIVNEYLLRYTGRIRKKQSIMQRLKKQEMTLLNEKQFISDKLSQNKEILEYYKNSQCLREIEANKEQLEEIKKEIKLLDKDSNQLLSEEVQINLFTFEIKSNVEKVEREMDPENEPVDPKLINDLINQINIIVEERRGMEKKHFNQVQGLEKHIKFMLKNNSDLERELRQLTNDEMQKALDKKKMKIKNYRSSVFLPKEAKERREKPHPIEKKQNIQPWEQHEDEQAEHQHKDQILDIERSFQERPMSSSKTLVIGKWNEENCIKDDVIESGNISRAVSLKIRTKNKRIIGIGATYINKIGVEIIGRGNIWKNEKVSQEENEEDFEIDLEEIQWLRYSKSEQASIGMKWQLKNGDSVVIGNLPREEDIDSILLNDHWVIKTAEFCLDENFVNIAGIKFKLSEYSMNNPELEREEPVKPSLKQWRSLSNTELTKKKVVVKSHGKRLSQISQVDHRLLLNRKKKMV